MRKQRHIAILGIVGGFALLLSACGDCEQSADDASAFLAKESNQSCSDDADCRVVSTGCAPVAEEQCRKVTMNAAAAESAEWKEISEGFDDCDKECATCLAMLSPTCSAEGLCGEY